MHFWWVTVPDRYPRLGHYHLSSVEPPLEQAEVIIATGLRGNASVLPFKRRKFCDLWARAKVGNVNRSKDL